MQIPLIRLQCGVNSYDWGKLGNESAAAKYGSATGSDFVIQEDKPYAELWMGTHPSNPSKDLVTQRTLLDLVEDNRALLSTAVGERYGHKLPFLFKVLSIRKALSIQAHPNKKLAEQLHNRDSKNYPDDNHKPEMAIAITPFEGFCSFRPLAEISHFLSTVPPLKKLVGVSEAEIFQKSIAGRESSEKPEDEQSNKKALQKLFGALLKSTPQKVEEASAELIECAKMEVTDFAGGGGPVNEGKELADLVIQLNDQFPGDIGLFVLFFLNYIKLEPGEAMFLQADDIHAYISGDVVECMAASDNVVRAGFTPKLKDVPTLIDMLTYSYAPISEQKMVPEDYPYVTMNSIAYSSASTCWLYDPPIEEFSVVMTGLKRKAAKATFEPIEGPSIFICTSGSGTISVGPKKEEMKTGYVFFVGATAEAVLESDGEEFTTFRAFCELDDQEEAEAKQKL